MLSKRILHYQLPNSSMLFFDTFQRKLHSVWFKGYHAVLKNRPKKFSFPKKYAHRILSEQILHCQLPNSDMLLFDIFQRKLHSVWFKGYHAVFKNRPKKFSFHKKYTNIILSEQILHYQLPNSGMLFFDIFQRKLQSVWFKGYHTVFKNRPKKFSFLKKYTHKNTVRANSSLSAPKFRYVVL